MFLLWHLVTIAMSWLRSSVWPSLSLVLSTIVISLMCLNTWVSLQDCISSDVTLLSCFIQFYDPCFSQGFHILHCAFFPACFKQILAPSFSTRNNRLSKISDKFWSPSFSLDFSLHHGAFLACFRQIPALSFWVPTSKFLTCFRLLPLIPLPGIFFPARSHQNCCICQFISPQNLRTIKVKMHFHMLFLGIHGFACIAGLHHTWQCIMINFGLSDSYLMCNPLPNITTHHGKFGSIQIVLDEPLPHQFPG